MTWRAPVHYAALALGANLNARCRDPMEHVCDGWTPAHHAAWENHVDVLRLLVFSGRADLAVGQRPSHSHGARGKSLVPPYTHEETSLTLSISLSLSFLSQPD